MNGNRANITLMLPTELIGVKTYPAKSARNLWSNFAENFTFWSHISAICSACFYHTQDLQRILHYLDLNSANALVSSRHNYCNSLLSGIADTDLAKLQCVQN